MGRHLHRSARKNRRKIRILITILAPIFYFMNGAFLFFKSIVDSFGAFYFFLFSFGRMGCAISLLIDYPYF